MRLGSSSSRWCSTSVGDFGLGRFAGSGRQRCLVATIAGCDKFGDLPAPLSPHSTHCSWIRWHQVPPYRWAGSVSQTMADSVQAAVLGSIVVPSKLCGTLLQPLGRRRQHARAYDEFWQICSAVTSTRNYFPAPDHDAARDIALYVEAIAGRGPFARQQFQYSCIGACSDNQTELSWLRLDEIQSARRSDCGPMTLKHPDCCEIEVGSGVGQFPKVFRVYGSNYMNKTIFVRVSVDVGMTLAGQRINNSIKPMPLCGAA